MMDAPKQRTSNMALDGDKIRELRIGKGFSQEKLAALCSISKRTVQRAEKGDAIALETVNFIADALDVPAKTLRRSDGGDAHDEIDDKLFKLLASVPPEQPAVHEIGPVPSSSLPLSDSQPVVEADHASAPMTLGEYMDGDVFDDPRSAYRSMLLGAIGFASAYAAIGTLGWYAYDWFTSTQSLRWYIGWPLFLGGFGAFWLTRMLDWFFFVRDKHNASMVEADGRVSSVDESTELYSVEINSAKGVRVHKRPWLRFVYLVAISLLLIFAFNYFNGSVSGGRSLAASFVVVGFLLLEDNFSKSYRVKALIDGAWIKVGDFPKSKAFAIGKRISSDVRPS